MASDPFTVVNDAAWNMLEGNADFVSLVKLGNRVKYDRDNPIKSSVSTADKPEVRLTPTGLLPRGNSSSILQTSSSTAHMTFGLEIQIATGEQRLIRKGTAAGRQTVYEVMFQTWRACLAWRDYFQSLTWGSPPVDFQVDKVGLNSTTVGVLLEDLDRDIRGWSTLMSLEIGMIMPLATHTP